MARTLLPGGIALSANHTLPMLLLRLRETMLLSLRPVFRQFDLTEQQARVLLVLSEAGKLKMLVLAETCCIQSPSLSRIIPKLCARGWIDRHRLDDDLRRVAVELTPAGHELATRLRDVLRHVHGGMKCRVGEAQVRVLTRELEAVLTTLGTPALTGAPGPDDGNEP